jgi:hypothetical protein
MTVSTQKYFIVSPQAASNININPSFELGTTGYTTGGTNTIARSSAVQRHGVYSCLVTYQDNDTLLSYAVTITNADHVGSVYVYIPTDYDGTDLKVGFSNFLPSSVVLGDVNMTIRDKWQRVFSTIDPSAMDLGGSFTVFENGTAPTAGKFIYIDAVQIELGTVPTTFIDPNNTEKINKIKQYGWNGSPNASTSYRLGTTRSGGGLVDIETYAKVLNVDGLGIGPVENTSTQLTDGTERHQSSYVKSRYFTMSLVFEGASIGAIAAKRLALTNLMKPDLVPGNQLITLMYEGYDSSGLIDSETLEIKCEYVDGFSRASQRMYKEFTDLVFRMPDAYIQSAADTGAVLGYQLAVADANNIIKRSSSGVYSKLGAAGLSAYVYKIIEGPDGRIYICGNFTNAGGSGADYITAYDPVADTFDDLGTSPDAIVNDIIFDAKGNLWACGNFANIGGSAIAKIAYMTVGTTTWNALGTGLNNNGKAMAFDMYGNLFVTGEFTAAGGVANTVYIAYWDGSAWKAIGTGLQARGLGIAINKGNLGIVVGEFTDAGGVSNTSKIALFTRIGFFSAGSANATATRVAVDNQDNFYVVGSFTTIGGVSYQFFAKYITNSGWQNSGFVFDGTGILYVSYDKETDKVYFMGDYTTINGITVLDKTIEYVSPGIFIPLDVDLPGAGIAASLLTSKNGTLYVGHSATGDAYTASVTVPSIISAKSYPIITATGPGTIWQIKNYLTGKAIYFKGLTLANGEVVTFDFRPGKITMESSFRGSVLSYVLPGSDYDFELLPGNNNVSAFMYGSTTAASGIVATWKQNYHSIDGAQL